MNFLPRLIVIVLLVLHTSSLVYASTPPGIVVYYSADNNFQTALTQAINKRLGKIIPDVKIRFNSNSSMPRIRADDLIISIGNHEEINNDVNVVGNDIIYIIDSKQSSTDNSRKNSYATIEITQTPCRHLNLIHTINKKWGRIGYITSDAEDHRLAQLQLCANKLNLEITQSIFHTEDELPNAIDRLLQSSDVLLALHDPKIYNRRSVKNILLSAYRLRVPVIGFSESFVNAGALASIYSTPDNIAEQVALIVQSRMRRNDKFKRTNTFPDKFTISINRQVARALDLYPADESTIIEAIDKMEVAQ